MDLSFAGRSPIELLARPLGLAGPRGRSSPAHRATARRTPPAGARQRPAARARGVLGAGRSGLALLRGHRRARIALVSAVLALPLLGGAWMWMRSSPLVAVEHVQLSGVHGPEAQAIEAALSGAARHMSTLDVRSGALRAAVAPFRVVREVRAIPSFPHGLRVRVVEQLPVAALTVGATRTAVAADGVVLGPALLSSSLPTLTGALALAPGEHVGNPILLASLTVLGAAPAPLERLVARSFTGPRGLTLAMRSGLLAYFGDATRPHAKWLSLARVLADPSSAGAAYIDVRVPERPAAGFPAGLPPSDASAPAAAPAGGEQGASSESTVAALAAGLTGASGGAAAASTGTESASAPAAEPSTAPSSTQQAAPATPEHSSSEQSVESSPAGAPSGTSGGVGEH